MNKKLLNSIWSEAENLLNELLTARPSKLEEIPKSGGVYLAYNRKGRVIYIGKAVNLRRRILEDHRSGDTKMSTSTLQRKVYKIYTPDKPLTDRPAKNWVRNNCSFVYIIIDEHDLRDLVEVLAISYFRKSGANLLNFYRK